MRKPFLALVALIAISTTLQASDFTDAAGRNGTIASGEALSGCEGGCYIFLTNDSDGARVEVRSAKTDEVIGHYTKSPANNPRVGPYSGLPEDQVPAVSHAPRPRSGAKVYTNADLRRVRR